MLFGPIQSGLSVRASPHKYFSCPPPSHFDGILDKLELNSEHNMVVICNKNETVNYIRFSAYFLFSIYIKLSTATFKKIYIRLMIRIQWVLSILISISINITLFLICSSMRVLVKCVSSFISYRYLCILIVNRS